MADEIRAVTKSGYMLERLVDPVLRTQVCDKESGADNQQERLFETRADTSVCPYKRPKRIPRDYTPEGKSQEFLKI